jgi:ketosteroid isomerase-like protein
VSHPAIDTYFEAINSEDWDRLRTIWADDAVVIAVGAPPRVGPDAIMRHYMKLFNAFTAHCDTATRTLPSGDAYTVEVTFTGTTHDGRDVTFDAVDVFDVREEKIVRLTNWYDLVYVRKLLEGNS